MIQVDPPAQSPETIEILTYATATLQKIASCTPHELANAPRSIVLSLFSIVMLQHYEAIVTLCVMQRTPATVDALFRPLVDAYVRGHWLFTSPSEETITNFFRKESFKFPHFNRMVGDLARRTGAPGYFKPFIDMYSIMCDFTHTGVLQISHHFSDGQTIGPHDSDRRTRMLLREATKVTLLNFVFLTRKFATDNGAKELVAGAEELEAWAEQCPMYD